MAVGRVGHRLEVAQVEELLDGLGHRLLGDAELVGQLDGGGRAHEEPPNDTAVPVTQACALKGSR